MLICMLAWRERKILRRYRKATGMDKPLAERFGSQKQRSMEYAEAIGANVDPVERREEARRLSRDTPINRR